MKFEEKRELIHVENNNDLTTFLETPVLVGAEYIASWQQDGDTYGSNTAYLYPCYSKGKLGFFLHLDWEPSFGYSASITEQQLLSLEEGIKLLCTYGQWEDLRELFFGIADDETHVEAGEMSPVQDEDIIEDEHRTEEEYQEATCKMLEASINILNTNTNKAFDE